MKKGAIPFKEMDDVCKDGVYLVGSDGPRYNLRKYLAWLSENNIETPEDPEECRKIFKKAEDEGIIEYFS